MDVAGLIGVVLIRASYFIHYKYTFIYIHDTNRLIINPHYAHYLCTLFEGVFVLS